MKRLLVTLVAAALLVGGCADQHAYSRSVYMLVDTSGTYTAELNKAGQIINYVLARLHPGDSFAVAKIDSASFTEKDIVAKAQFDSRPSRANAEKRAFHQQIGNFIASVNKGSAYTDISGGMLQAVEWLRETQAGEKTILIFSDLKEDLPKGHVRKFPLKLKGIDVVAINVTKLRSDNVDPRRYIERLAQWRKKVESGGGHWRVVNDLDRLDGLLKPL
ncbi:MAG: VWA domain-containing protein [Gammaproteobacteria bacterium]